eukprot:scaffold94890_cov35-Tisochrysis_lutea.AAC.1
MPGIGHAPRARNWRGAEYCSRVLLVDEEKEERQVVSFGPIWSLYASPSWALSLRPSRASRESRPFIFARPLVPRSTYEKNAPSTYTREIGERERE